MAYKNKQDEKANKLARRHTPDGAIKLLYNNQRRACRHRGMDQPSYTLQELKDWVFVHGYQALFDAWAGSGFKRMCAPSVDRLDSSKSYTFDNIRLVPWQENIDKIGLDNFRNPRSTNKSGVSGVHANKHAEYVSSKPWTVAFRVKGKRYYLGIFKTMEEAIAVRVKWMEENQQLLYPGL